MNILFLTHYYYPHIGGVETHVYKLADQLNKKGHTVTIITEKYDIALKSKEKLNGANVVRISYPGVKYLGLIFIWRNLWSLRNILKKADVVHIHDVFIWYLPIRFLYPHKKVFTTFHGWEGAWPIPVKNIFLKKIASNLSLKTVVIGKYIEKYYGMSADKVLYGASDRRVKFAGKKIKNKFIFVGRLESDTGLIKFLEYIKVNKIKDVVFVGDGSLKQKCESLGTVTGFTDPTPYYKTAEYVVPAGYLSYINAKSYECKIMTFSNNDLKKDYWDEIKKVKKFPTWRQLTEEYVDLYKFTG